MELVLQAPHLENVFSNLGYSHSDGYHIDDNCKGALETILHNILIEDKYLRNYRRRISFGENVKKDLIPLLTQTQDKELIELLIKILMNLSIPTDCLLSVDAISKTDFGRHTIFDINRLLTSVKVAFSDNKVCKAVVDFLKINVNDETTLKLSLEKCMNINNCLLLLRNLLYIPEEVIIGHTDQSTQGRLLQNQIIWNLFSQTVDKVLIKLMMVPEVVQWAVTMVQLIALLYKDQHVITLHKLINMWLEASLSESSEDNESNTSFLDRVQEDSSLMLTSDPTSDSSDTSNGGKPKKAKLADDKTNAAGSLTTVDVEMCDARDSGSRESINNQPSTSKQNSSPIPQLIITTVINELTNNAGSDPQYFTPTENKELFSNSSTEDDSPKVVHIKPHNLKHKMNNKRPSTSLVPMKNEKKKLFSRGRINLFLMHGLLQKGPTDEDVANLMKEFTIDFLMKCFDTLVRTLHNQMLTNQKLEIDSSHFFWLVSYFLKFATQIELDFEYISSVLSFEILSFLTVEGVRLSEQLEIAIGFDGCNTSNLRRLNLVVTAIREYIQALEMYKKFTNPLDKHQDTLLRLKLKVGEMSELRSLFVLLLRQYNSKHHSKQYLKDLVVTNHILLMNMESVCKMPEYKGVNFIKSHMQHFATPKVMYNYGLVLEDYASNGEFVNDCVFTMMHHVGGDLDGLQNLLQPKILKTFSAISESEFEICDDWTDLIQYAINTVVKNPHLLLSNKPKVEPDRNDTQELAINMIDEELQCDESNPGQRWSEDEISSLNWYYMKSKSAGDVIGLIVEQFNEEGITKSRDDIVLKLYQHNIITKEEYERLLACEETIKNNGVIVTATRVDEITKLLEQAIQEGKEDYLMAIQRNVLDICLAKIYLESTVSQSNESMEMINFLHNYYKEPKDVSELSCIACNFLLRGDLIPLVSWNCKLSAIHQDQTIMQLLNKFGFLMPVDTGMIFIRIPGDWNSETLLNIARLIAPIQKQTN